MPTQTPENPGIVLLGLGPGDPGLLTRQAWQVLENCDEIYLRTRHHPVVDFLPAQIQLHSFDDLYDGSQSFDEVYQRITAEILRLGKRPAGVVYAVPGHPFVAEATCPEIARQARQDSLPVSVVNGLSFLETTFTALGLDPFPHTFLVDALELATQHIPQFPPSTPAIIAQIHSRVVASDVKLTLMAHYPDHHPVTLVHGAGTNLQRVEALELYQIDRSEHIGLLTCLYVPALGGATSFEAFQDVIAHLRAPDGCPWDRVQTHQSLRSYLLEETYEALVALDAGDVQGMCEEFGDLLLQIVLHAQIAAEEGEFTMVDILQSINHKIVRRHPHVFADVQIQYAQGVVLNWEKLKAEERAQNGKAETSLLDSVAPALPALSQASEYLKRVARVGFEWPDIQGAIRKLEEELSEVYQADDPQQRNLEIGDLLFTVVNLARWYEIDAESALREANQRFKLRFSFIEGCARAQNRAVSDLQLDEMLKFWGDAKLAGL